MSSKPPAGSSTNSPGFAKRVGRCFGDSKRGASPVDTHIRCNPIKEARPSRRPARKRLAGGRPLQLGMSRNLPQWLEYIEQQHPRTVELGLDRMRAVAGRMDLQRPARKVVTVGGTNGKGSTVAFIEAIARAAGWRVGAYTSPHLLAYNERVRIDGRDADDADLVAGFEAVEA